MSVSRFSGKGRAMFFFIPTKSANFLPFSVFLNHVKINGAVGKTIFICFPKIQKYGAISTGFLKGMLLIIKLPIGIFQIFFIDRDFEFQGFSVFKANICPEGVHCPFGIIFSQERTIIFFGIFVRGPTVKSAALPAITASACRLNSILCKINNRFRRTIARYMIKF